MLSATREMRKETDVLNDVADRPTQPDRIPLARVPALHEHVARVGQEQSVDELEHGRLAGAARADQRERLPGADRQRDVVEDRAGRQCR